MRSIFRIGNLSEFVIFYHWGILFFRPSWKRGKVSMKVYWIIFIFFVGQSDVDHLKVREAKSCKYLVCWLKGWSRNGSEQLSINVHKENVRRMIFAFSIHNCQNIPEKGLKNMAQNTRTANFCSTNFRVARISYRPIYN